MLLASQGATANATGALVHGGRAFPVGDVLDGWLTHGDVVRAAIDGAGVIENRVVDESRAT